MLKTLIIDNLTLIDHVELDFNAGLICFTGETGAGKSVFLSALKLLAGQRCERMALRPGTETCKIEALFSFNQEQCRAIDALLTSNDIPVCENGELILRRSFGKQQKISINGTLTSLNVLKSLGKFWLEFHTPNEPQRLFSKQVQMELLDRFANIEQQAHDYQINFREYTQLQQQLQTLIQEVRSNPGVIDFLKKQCKLFETLELTSDFIEQLELDFKRVNQKETCLQILQNIHNCFNETPGLNESIDRLQHFLASLQIHWPQAQSLVEQCQQVRIEIQDIENTCTQEQNTFDLDPEQCQHIQQNMQVWLELKHHYGPSLSQVIQAKQELQNKLDILEHGETKIQALQMQCSKLETICREKAQQLHHQREQCLQTLTFKITECLQTLGFQHPKFEIQLECNNILTQEGLSEICFKFASDKTLPSLPLNQVASSGELSRILLALKNVLNDTSNIPVLVFDEIDANVGGEIGQKVGNLLKNLGKRAQIFCVTHLPQVAGQAHWHYLVSKSLKDTIPTIQFKMLDTPELRSHELARMLGDAKSTSALKHAQTLLSV